MADLHPAATHESHDHRSDSSVDTLRVEPGMPPAAEYNSESSDSHSDDKSSDHAHLKSEPKACLFIGSLNVTKTDQQLHDGTFALFEQFGEVLDLKISRDKHGRPYAFVQFIEMEAADKAMKFAQGALLHDRYIRIERAKVNRTLICHLKEPNHTKGEVVELIHQFGEVEDFIYWTESPRSTPSHHIMAKFKYRECAAKAFSSLRKERHCTIEWASNATQPPSLGSVSQLQALSRTGYYYRFGSPGKANRGGSSAARPLFSMADIFVGNLDSKKVSKSLLHSRFSEFGSIESVDIHTSVKPMGAGMAYGRPSGSDFSPDHCTEGASAHRPTGPTSHAFIKFTDEMAAAKAIVQMDRQVWLGYPLRVTYKEIRTPIATAAPAHWRATQRRHSLMHWQPFYPTGDPASPWMTGAVPYDNALLANYVWSVLPTDPLLTATYGHLAGGTPGYGPPAPSYYMPEMVTPFTSPSPYPTSDAAGYHYGIYGVAPGSVGPDYEPRSSLPVTPASADGGTPRAAAGTPTAEGHREAPVRGPVAGDPSAGWAYSAGHSPAQTPGPSYLDPMGDYSDPGSPDRQGSPEIIVTAASGGCAGGGRDALRYPTSTSAADLTEAMLAQVTLADTGTSYAKGECLYSRDPTIYPYGGAMHPFYPAPVGYPVMSYAAEDRSLPAPGTPHLSPLSGRPTAPRGSHGKPGYPLGYAGQSYGQPAVGTGPAYRQTSVPRPEQPVARRPFNHGHDGYLGSNKYRRNSSYQGMGPPGAQG